MQISRLRDEAKRAESEVQSLQQEVGRLQFNVQKRDRKLTGADEEHENLQTRVEQATRDAEEARKKQAAAEESTRVVQAKLDEITHQLSLTRSELARAAHSDEEKVREVDDLTLKLKLAEEARDSLSRRVHEAQWGAEQAKREVESRMLDEQAVLRKKLAAKEHELQSLRWYKENRDGQGAAVVAQAEAAVEGWKRRCHALREQLQQRVTALHAQQVAQFDDLVDEKEAQLRDMEDRVNALETEKKELEAYRDQAEPQLAQLRELAAHREDLVAMCVWPVLHCNLDGADCYENERNLAVLV